MKHYIYITPEGTINWIDKMPEKTKALDICGMLDTSVYESDLKRAKSESIPFEDQHTIEGFVISHLDRHPKSDTIKMRWDTIYPIELDADIQKVYQYHSSKQHYVDADWNDCTKEQYDSLVGSNIGKPRIVARIITKITSEL